MAWWLLPDLLAGYCLGWASWLPGAGWLGWVDWLRGWVAGLLAGWLLAGWTGWLLGPAGLAGRAGPRLREHGHVLVLSQFSPPPLPG